jgi:hypothetical protein
MKAIDFIFISAPFFLVNDAAGFERKPVYFIELILNSLVSTGSAIPVSFENKSPPAN